MTGTPTAEQRVTNAQALERAGRWPEAIEQYERALALRADLTDSWYNLGRLRRLVGRYDAALDAYREALARGVRGPEEVHLNRAVIYADCLHRPAEARRELDAALAIAPDYLPALMNLGNLHEDLGEREAARACYERVLAVAPDDAGALARLANVTHVTAADAPIVARLRRALATQREPGARAAVGYALGRALDAAGDYDAAFAAYADANRASRESAPPGAPAYDRARMERFVDRSIATFATPDAVPRAAARGAAPVFVCGMFRSGSTLVEQVLAAHPRVTAGGELPWLPRLAAGISPYPEALRRATAADVERLADAYRAARREAFPGADVLTDKRPDNFVHVGLAKAMFPHAKIVHTVREPLDNVLSVWFLHLDHSMAYATDLLDTAHYLRACRRLMAHWERLYPDDVLRFDYDAFVREPRPALERLLAFCGLDWHDACLDFHRAPTRVQTASVWQVREPLYRRSSGRWRNYERHLAAVRAYLADGA